MFVACAMTWFYKRTLHRMHGMSNFKTCTNLLSLTGQLKRSVILLDYERSMWLPADFSNSKLFISISMHFSVAQTRLIANQSSRWFVQMLRQLMSTVNMGSVCFSKLLVLPCQTTHFHAVLFNYIWSCDIHWRYFIVICNKWQVDEE